MAQDGIWWLLLPFCALSSASYRGREFLAVFPQNDDESPSTYLQLLLTSYGPTDTQVSVMLRGGSVTRNVTLGPDLTVPLSLPADLELTGSRTSHKTLVVQASADISVVAVSTKSYTVGATALLPVESLGTRYYMVTPVGNYTYGLTEFVVAAGAAITTVSITTTATFHHSGGTPGPRHFSWAIITVHATTQSVENLQVPIGLLVFGFQGQTGYGFPGLCAT
ncbi:PREDICTED: IgGFc-binding protein-like, partial [Corvus brachyrhynchos]|uniref:IgGFc-binding protein-like n=1 Tax=Corvus brachyrhynchos TaxID=85066 RepID=UPI0008164669